jgi:chromosome segregation ATPase
MMEEPKEKWYEKVWKWLKNWWGVVAGVALFIVGFIVGRKPVSGINADYERLRASFAELQGVLEDNKRTIEHLVRLKHEADGELYVLGGKLEESRLEIERARAELGKHDGNVSDLDDAIGRIRATLEKHREELESIQVRE